MNDPASSVASGADMFLHVQTKRAGKVKGEASTEGHTDDIEVRAWHWGVAAGSAIGSTAATARRQYNNLVVVKGIDSASTGLLSALATNDEVKEAKLTIRKAGGDALDYYVMTLGQARVVAIDLDVDEQGGPTETISFAYTRIDVEYKRQQGSGISGASTSFSDEVLKS
ncbi:MAG: type VI secretion system tube protein Hcp [Pseudomonadota bacterium]|nr:type VI secretion system tube protein Hcp [Pseudomonadota bacterium]